ncbi:MAG: hypothetical protein RBR06_04105 [Desulfuromonadaceae bacterium]|nr:hypothetical protein [Desulfuromonadaceae bacterium]
MFLTWSGNIASSGLAAPFPEDDLPAVLKPWCAWVLTQNEDINCALTWNEANKRMCSWPSHLQLNADSSGAEFTLQGYLGKKGWVILPGSAHYWPQNVTNGGKKGAVLRQQHRPALLLEAGSFNIHGRLSWDQLPDSIPLTPDVALLDLKLDGKTIALPAYSRGQLQLRQNRLFAQTGEDGVKFQIFRHLEDRIPQIMTTKIRLQVSGTEREILTATVLPAGFTPLEITSAVPARLESDGRLRLLAQAGEYEIEIRARAVSSPQKQESFRRPATNGPWAEDELWCIERHAELRSVSISGASALDPAQTDIPPQWRHLPVYLMHPDSVIGFTQHRRGAEPAPADRLRVQRELWLDFSGNAYSVKDNIAGELVSSSRLETGPELELGRVKLNGEEQFITRLQKTGSAGIEVRRQQLDLQADSRINLARISAIPAFGWQFSPTELHTKLHLPPGWRVLAASGADNTSGTWIQQWSLLDLFIVLLLSLGFGRMWGWKYGLLALGGLVMTYQEPGAPQFIWLHLLGGAALLRVAPPGRLHRLVRIYLGGAALAMTVLFLLFATQQIRTAIYPQLEPLPPEYSGRKYQTVENVQRDSVSMKQVPSEGRMLATSAVPRSMQTPSSYPEYTEALETQTGPGIPTWGWRSVWFEFNSGVEPEQRLQLVYLTPFMTKTCLVAGVLLILGMFGRVGSSLCNNGNSSGPPGIKTPQGEKCARRINLLPDARQHMLPHILLFTLIILTSILSVLPSTANARNSADSATIGTDGRADHGLVIPSSELLEELRRRLTLPPDCAPNCVALQQISVTITDDTLSIEQQLHSATLSAVPLAFPLQELQPRQATSTNDKELFLLRSTDNQLWARVPAGITHITLKATIPAGLNQLEIPLPVPPGNIHLVTSPWEAVNQTTGNVSTISLKRLSTQPSQGEATAEFTSTGVPLYVEVKRHLDLGVEWQVETTLTRVSQKGSAGVIEVPLLEHEQIITAGIKTKEHQALVEFGPETERVRWRSNLSTSSPILLQANTSKRYHEVWQLELSSLWHAQYSGTPLIYTYQNGRWLAQWQPRDFEQLQIDLLRPQGAPGQHVTVEECNLRHNLSHSPNHTATTLQRSESSLHLKIRSSMATRHTIVLPEYVVEVREVRINGRDTRIEQKGTELTVPLQAGMQQIEISWRSQQQAWMVHKTPTIDLGAPAVNIDLNFTLPQTRWILLTGGSGLGPAVLFWGVILVIAMVSILLGRYAPTPLRWWHWFILSAGLSQAPLSALLLVGLWLILLGMRKNYADRIHNPAAFNALQLGLGILSLCAMLALITAVQHGLLGLPEMQIAGSNSSAWNLHWYQDRSAAVIPSVWVFSVPMLMYRILMLVWALWLAVALLKWLRWGWNCFSAGQIWLPLKPRSAASEPSRPAAADMQQQHNTFDGDR